MADESKIKIELLDELIEEMQGSVASRFKPKAPEPKEGE